MNQKLILSCLTIMAAHAVFASADQYKPAAGWPAAISGPGVPGGQNSQGYAMGRDPTAHINGTSAYTIKSLTADASKWRCITQGVRADAYRGKRVRLRGYIKTREASTGAGLWMRVDAVDREQNFDNMTNRLIKGSAGWKRCDVVLDVPKDASLIFFGALIAGNGQMWVGDLSLEPVPESVALTADWTGPDYSHDPQTIQNVDFTYKPMTDSGLDIPGWTTTTGTWDEQISLDPKVTHNGKPSARMYATKGGWNTLSLWQEILAAPYRGKKIEYKVFVKTDGIVGGGGPSIAFPGGGQWLVADIPKFVLQGKKWVEDKREWKPVSVVGFVPDWANCIQIGVQMNSAGRIWVSDGSFRVVPNSTPVTYGPQPQKIYTAAQVKSFPMRPSNLNFTR